STYRKPSAAVTISRRASRNSSTTCCIATKRRRSSRSTEPRCGRPGSLPKPIRRGCDGTADAGNPRVPLDTSNRLEGRKMPEKMTIKRARRDARQGKAPSTQAGEFVREEIHHVREGKHGARSTKQAIAIGLSKARRAGV